MIPAELADRYARLDPRGRPYLLGWLVGAIKDSGQATAADLEAALPHAERWAASWPEEVPA